MRLQQFTARGRGSDHAHHLNGADRNGALNDGHGNPFTRIPLVMENALHPFFRRNQAGFLAWQVDAGAPAQAQPNGVIMNPFNSHALTDGIKENVARIDDGLMKIGYAVSRGPPAVKDSPVKISVSRTKRSELRRERLGFKHRGGHHDLEHG